MNRFKALLVVIPERGHINPMIGVAKCLYDMNIDIAFFAQADISDQLEKAGINCRCYTPEGNYQIPDDLIAHGADFANKLKDKEWLQRWIKTLLLDTVPFLVDSLEKLLSFFKPDVIVSDPMVYASGIVAESKKIPWVGISNSLNPLTPKEWSSDLIETLNKYHPERLALFSNQQSKVCFSVADLRSPWLNIVFTSEMYIPRDWSSNDFSFYVGTPFSNNGLRGDETPFPFEKLDTGKKIVYMSLGSMVYYHPTLFTTVAKALEGLNVQLILSVGSLYLEDFAKKFPEDTIILPYVPQLQVLEHVDVMVSHGGANSVTECLSKGIPMALIPICNDQFFQARFLKRAKAGIVLSLDNQDVHIYRKALIELLKEDSSYRKNVQILKKSFNKYKGPKEAADLIHELLKKKQPLKPDISVQG